MAMYWKEITVNWGESDPFGLVYYPRIVAWFNDTEHELFRVIGYPIEQMIKNDRTTFVMGEIHFRFIGPAAYGDRIVNTITLAEVGNRTLHWNCKAKNAVTGAPVSEGKATRVYARINERRLAELAADPGRDADRAQRAREPDPPEAEQRRDEARRRAPDSHGAVGAFAQAAGIPPDRGRLRDGVNPSNR